MHAWSEKLIAWYSEHKRDLPWRLTKDPYQIWLSEIILQQTRVQQGLPYFERFMTLFPTVDDLASASLEQVMHAWQGLGYYSRARNLHQAANQVVHMHGGKFPATHAELLKLKGVGPYTAAAIASFAFDLPHPVVDGNVYRVLSRYFGMHEAIDQPAAFKLYAAVAEKLLPPEQPADFNQAIMEFGATQCVPANPDCDNCIFASDCVAFAKAEVSLLPLKAGKVKVKSRYFNYLVLHQNDGVFMKERLAKDIWQHLWDFELKESESALQEQEIFAHMEQKFSFLPEDFQLKAYSEEFTHLLTHQRITSRFWLVQIFSNLHDKELKFVPVSTLDNKPLPRLIDKFIKKYRQWLD